MVLHRDRNTDKADVLGQAEQLIAAALLRRNASRGNRLDLLGSRRRRLRIRLLVRASVSRLLRVSTRGRRTLIVRTVLGRDFWAGQGRVILRCRSVRKRLLLLTEGKDSRQSKNRSQNYSSDSKAQAANRHGFELSPGFAGTLHSINVQTRLGSIIAVKAALAIEWMCPPRKESLCC